MKKFQEIVQKFSSVVLRWLTANYDGSVTLTVHLHRGGVSDWIIRTEGKGD